MNNFSYDLTPASTSDAMPSDAQYPDDLSLSPSYRQLEGFTLTGSDLEPLTMTDFYKETTVLASDSASNKSQDGWADTLMTFVVMIGLLVASSVALGLAARQATVITQRLTHHTTQQALKNVNTPRSWQF